MTDVNLVFCCYLFLFEHDYFFFLNSFRKIWKDYLAQRFIKTVVKDFTKESSNYQLKRIFLYIGSYTFVVSASSFLCVVVVVKDTFVWVRKNRINYFIDISNKRK